MNRRVQLAPHLLVAVALFGIAIGLPSIALIGRAMMDGDPPTDGFTFTARQLALLWRSLWLSGVATAACLLLALPAAYTFCHASARLGRGVMACLMATLLLTSPMVYAFGWTRVMPDAIPASIRCIFVWGMWTWPIPAALISAGWTRAGKLPFEAALTETSPARALGRIALPAVGPHLLLSALILFLLFFSDYSTPHTFLTTVFSTELLGWASSSGKVIDVLWPSLPAVGITLIALVMLVRTGARAGWYDGTTAIATAGEGTSVRARWGPSVFLGGLFAMSYIVPIGALLKDAGSATVFADAIRTYQSDIVWSFGLAALAGAIAILIGFGLLNERRLLHLGLVWSILFGALPGALIGEALLAAYNHRVTAWLYDHWPIVALSYIARFTWIGIAAAVFVDRVVPGDVKEQAQTDGASDRKLVTHVLIPIGWPVALCGGGIVAVLSLADVAASTLVRVPGFSPIAQVLIEKFHRFEDGMLISLSAILVLASLPVALLVTLAARRVRLA